jgi:hypothetical protein
MKNLGYYFGSAVLGLSLAVGVGSCEKPIPSETVVKLENVQYYENDGNPVCLYYADGRNAGSFIKGERKMAISHTAWISDGDYIKDIWQEDIIMEDNFILITTYLKKQWMLP